jgi:hypothetical protein
MSEEIRRLVEQIRREHPAPSGAELTEQSIPLLTEVVSPEALLAGGPFQQAQQPRPLMTPQARESPSLDESAPPDEVQSPSEAQSADKAQYRPGLLARAPRTFVDETRPVSAVPHPGVSVPGKRPAQDEGFEARIVGQALALLQSPTSASGALLDEAIRTATARLADRVAVELQHCLQTVLLEQIQPVLREAVQGAVQQAIEHEASRSRPL